MMCLTGTLFLLAMMKPDWNKYLPAVAAKHERNAKQYVVCPCSPLTSLCRICQNDPVLHALLLGPEHMPCPL